MAAWMTGSSKVRTPALSTIDSGSVLNTRLQRVGLSAIALLFGGLTYAALRPSPRALLDLASLIGFREALWVIKEACTPLKQSLPTWVIYSLPDGLWLLSLLAALDVVWSGHVGRSVVLRSASAIAISLEAAQSAWPYLGTFDSVDLLALACGAVYCAIPPLRSMSVNGQEWRTL